MYEGSCKFSHRRHSFPEFGLKLRQFLKWFPIGSRFVLERDMGKVLDRVKEPVIVWCVRSYIRESENLGDDESGASSGAVAQR
jgi:hypothetical protein